MDLLVRFTRRKAVTTELFPLPIQNQFFLLALLLFCDAFFHHFSRGLLTISNDLSGVSVTPTDLNFFVAVCTFVQEKDFQLI